jgi:class 3 adenylate cyclase
MPAYVGMTEGVAGGVIPAKAVIQVFATVTMLFCDLVGSTPLAEQLNPEERR